MLNMFTNTKAINSPPTATTTMNHSGCKSYFVGPKQTMQGGNRSFWQGNQGPNIRSFSTGSNCSGNPPLFQNFSNIPNSNVQNFPKNINNNNNNSNNNNNNNTTGNGSNSIINGIKNIVNGLINPRLRCDFYSNHHHYYNNNQKFRNNYKLKRGTADMRNNKPNCPETPHLKTVILDLDACNLSANHPQGSNNCKKEDSNMDTEIVAIFTSEDFPELPAPKKFPTMTAWEHKPKEKCKYFQNRKQPTEKQAQMAECDSDDSFIVFGSSPPCSNSKKSKGRLQSFKRRERQISECSDDSFVICFTDDAAAGAIEFIDVDSDTESEEEDDEDDDSSDDDDVDEVDGEVIGGKCKIDQNRKKTDKTVVADGGSSQPDSGFDEHHQKKVQFDLKPKVHMMCTWSFAYRNSRKGPWEQIARDRSRFKQRVENLSEALNPILDSNHRKKIYEARFHDIDTAATTTPTTTTTTTTTIST